ncbi:DUF302 domain-containing protein [Thermocrinis sp.]|uniref:DUF302 domain-containing protein n=1 Tax=Thermocrinis sp. TaxID=2024383 RepID=UPI002FDCFA17
MVKALLITLLLFFSSFAKDPMKAMYLTYLLKEKNFKEAVDKLKKGMEEGQVKVIRVLTISDAIRARGSTEFPNYYVIFACETPKMRDILIKAPALSNVIPCSIAVHQSKENGKIYATIINENMFLSKYGHKLTKQERMEIKRTYENIRYVLTQMSGVRLKPVRIPPPKEDLVYEEGVKSLSYEDFKMLFKTSLDGVNMNVLDVLEVSKESPKFSIFLACNLSYGEAILNDIPQFGTLAPCRIYVYEKPEGSLAVGYINIPFLLKSYSKYLKEDKAEIFRKADKDIKSAIKEAKGE